MGEIDESSHVERLKTEVLKLIAGALDSEVKNPTAVLDFDQNYDVDFYQEVAKFEIELIRQALIFTKGNQRAAARLLGLKPSTFHSKVKGYNLAWLERERRHD